MITVISKFNIKPNHIEMFKTAMLENQKEVQKEAGNQEMKLFQDTNNPSIFFVYGRTKDEAALNTHVAETEDRGIEERVKDALAEPPTTYFLNETEPLPDHSKSANPEDDVFIIFFIFKIHKAFREKLLTQFKTHIEHTRKEEKGNILFDLYTVQNDETTLAVYEHWRKESDVWDIHFNQPYAVITGKLMEEAVVGDMKQYMHFVKEIN